MPLFYLSVEINNFVVGLARYRVILNGKARHVDLSALSVIVFEISDLARYLEPLSGREVGLEFVEAENAHHLDVGSAARISLSLKDECPAVELPEDDGLAYKAYSLAVITVHVIHRIGVEKTEVFCGDVAGILLEVKGKVVFDPDDLVVLTKEIDAHAGINGLD